MREEAEEEKWCLVLLEMDDSLNSIGFNINTAMQLSKIGGGVALNLSKLRDAVSKLKVSTTLQVV